MKSNQIRIAVLLGSISVIGIIAFQIYWVNKTFNLAEQQFNQTIEIALYNVAEKMADFNKHELPNENPVRQISSNYFIVDINDMIDASILDHYLKTEFEYRNIRIDYEYAIYDCETDKMVFGSYYNPSEEASTQNNRAFQKYDEFTYYFGIIFPSKTLYILKTMNIWIISTFVLITALVFFAYAIFVILRQKRLSEIQRDFINNMTHEFKTPVSTIAISAKVLSDPSIINDPERLHNYAEIIETENKRLEQQIDKVLQVARIETNKFKLHKEAIEIDPLLMEISQAFARPLKEKNGNISLDLNLGSKTIFADRHHMMSVIYNLLDNAVKYSGNDAQIIIKTSLKAESVEISIQDNGIGIPKHLHKKIFDKFYRISSGDIHNVKGFGIGLNYVKNIINEHNWQIKLVSESGRGSTFIIIIPN